jgi:hypothetical protein
VIKIRQAENFFMIGVHIGASSKKLFAVLCGNMLAFPGNMKRFLTVSLDENWSFTV